MFSRLMDTHKGRRVDGNLTICETIRQIYDQCVCGLSGKDDDLLGRLIPLIERAFIAGIKMNKRLCEYKIDTMEFFPDSNDTDEALRLRKERIRLIELLDANNQILNEFSKEPNS